MASCGSEKKAEEVYRATLNNKQKFRKEKKVRDEIQANRQLISQLQRNIRELKWNPQLGFIQIQQLIKENAVLVDSEDGANNYAEFCIHPDAQYKNKSAEWKSSITADHPMFKDLGKKKGNIPVQKDMVLKSILQSKSGSQPKPVPSFASLTTSNTRSTSNPPSFKNLTNQMKSGANNMSDTISTSSIDSRKQESSLKKVPKTSKWSNLREDKVSSLQEIVTVSDHESPEFDLCPDDDIIIEDEEESLPGPVGFNNKSLSNNIKPLFNKNQNPQSILGPGPAQNPSNFKGRNAPTLNRGGAAAAASNNMSSGRGQTSSFLDKIRGSVHQPGSRAAGGRNGGGQNNGGYNGGGQNRAGASRNWNQQPEESSGSGGNHGSNNSGKPNQPVSAFKTAHQQLFIDQQNKNRRGGRGGGYQGGRGGMSRPAGGQGGSGEITHASYGGGGVKKCLGTRPGPASGFKPPVKQEDQQPDQQTRGFGGPGNSNAAAYNQGQGQGQGNQEENPEYQDPRYKNIDQKMIELILNEIMDHGSPVHWDDIAGLKFQKKTVKEIVVLPMLRPDIFTGLRGPPKGLLLFGPPGTGKTLIGKCIACQSKSTFFSISASSLTSKWVGEGEKMVRALFAVAKVHQPSVIFIDEIDSLLSARSESEHESSRRMKTEFLVQLDGAGTDGDEKILIVGATNRPQELDEAARRRLVKRLLIPLPEGEARLQIIKNLLGKERNDLSEEDMDDIVSLSSGYSGADMANLCREAAMGPIRSVDISMIEDMDVDQVRAINKQDLVDALRQVKASVSDQDLQMYEEWNEKYGAGK